MINKHFITYGSSNSKILSLRQWIYDYMHILYTVKAQNLFAGKSKYSNSVLPHLTRLLVHREEFLSEQRNSLCIENIIRFLCRKRVCITLLSTLWMHKPRENTQNTTDGKNRPRNKAILKATRYSRPFVKILVWYCTQIAHFGNKQIRWPKQTVGTHLT